MFQQTSAIALAEEEAKEALNYIITLAVDTNGEGNMPCYITRHRTVTGKMSEAQIYHHEKEVNDDFMAFVHALKIGAITGPWKTCVKYVDATKEATQHPMTLRIAKLVQVTVNHLPI